MASGRHGLINEVRVRRSLPRVQMVLQLAVLKLSYYFNPVGYSCTFDIFIYFARYFRLDDFLKNVGTVGPSGSKNRGPLAF